MRDGYILQTQSDTFPVLVACHATLQDALSTGSQLCPLGVPIWQPPRSLCHRTAYTSLFVKKGYPRTDNHLAIITFLFCPKQDCFFFGGKSP